MILKIFRCAQCFNKSSAIHPDSEVLPMGGFPYDLVRMVGRFEVFTEMRGLRLRLFGFGNVFLPGGK
jgi:hypothetical protein